MAKTTTTKRVFKIVDLVRKRDTFKYIEVPNYPVEVTIEVTTSALLTTPKPAPSAVFDRLEGVARAKLEEYEETITEELVKIEKTIGELLSSGNPDAQKKAQQMIEATMATVKKALATAEPAAQKAMDERMKKEVQGDKLLVEARVGVAIKVTTGAISLAANVSKLVVTAGADVTSYLSIAKTLYSLGSELRQQLKSEEKLQADLKAGLNAFLETRATSIMEAATRQNLTDVSKLPKDNPKEAMKLIIKGVMGAGAEVTKGRDAGTVAKEVLDYLVKAVMAKLKDVESARVAYRNHTAKMRQQVDSISAKADELSKAMKAAGNLKDGVKIGADCMTLKATVRSMATALQAAETYLNEVQEVLKAGGLECDDQTVIQKLQKLDASTILSGAKNLGSTIDDIYNLATSVA